MSTDNAPSDSHEPQTVDRGAETTSPETHAGAPSAAAPAGAVDPERLKQDVVDVLRTIFDPEIPVNIYEIGLIYDLDVDTSGRVQVRMTLTSPMCPVAESLPPEVEAKINAVPGVNGVALDLVWEPPWNPQMMSEDARLLLGIG